MAGPYYIYSGAVGTGTGASWANAYTTLTAAIASKTAGDLFYVAHDHAESTAGFTVNATYASAANPIKVACANRAGSVPPVAADLRATATATSTGANDIFLNGSAHYNGIIFSVGSGAVSNSLFLMSSGTHGQRYDNCSLRVAGTSGGTIQVSATSAGGCYVELNNTTVSFANTGSSISSYGRFKWRNTASALLGTIPTTLFVPSSARGGSFECIGVDLSAAGSGKTLVGDQGSQSGTITFMDCKLNASVTPSATMTSGFGVADIEFIRCGSSGVNYTVRRPRQNGTLTEEVTIVRTGGASDATTPIAWKIVTTADSNYSLPFECPPIAIWNDTTGSSKTATIQGIWGGGAVPNDDEVWVELEYLSDASSPQATFVNDGKASALSTAAGQTAGAGTWGGSTTKFSLDVSFTAQQKGWVYARVRCAKASSTFYIDPLITLT